MTAPAPSASRVAAVPGPKAAATRDPRRPRRLRYAIYAAAVTTWIALLHHGLPYYRLGLAERLHNPAHASLRPSGGLGLLYGYIGTGLVLLLLLYSVRKRVPALRRLGSLGRWLNVHIFCGLAAPAMITLHSSLKVTGAIAIGYWAMIGVMLSGFVGYYLLRQVGGALHETEGVAESLDRDLAALDDQLRDRYGFSPASLEALKRRAGADRAGGMGPLESLIFLLGQDLLGVAESLGLIRRPAAGGLGRAEALRLRAITRERVVLERRRTFLRQTSAMFHYWHAIHRPFTIVLFLMMGLHIAIAAWLGYALPR